MQSTEHYHPLTISFHWLIVGMLIVEFLVGWLMPDIRRTITPQGLVSFHMSFGVMILAVMVLRVAWRLVSRSPAAPPAISWWQEMAARWVQYLLYAFVFVLIFTGWWIASTHGWKVDIFGIVTLPSIASQNASMARLADWAHIASITIVLGLIALHVLAALYHYFFLEDNVMQRMLPLQ